MIRGVETALRTGALEHPGPVFGVRNDGHASNLTLWH
jgi:hypothetical protein